MTDTEFRDECAMKILPHVKEMLNVTKVEDFYKITGQEEPSSMTEAFEQAFKAVARIAYGIADAMTAERNKHQL